MWHKKLRNHRPREMTPPRMSKDLKHWTERGFIHIKLEFTTGKLIERHCIPVGQKSKAKKIIARLEREHGRELIPRFPPPETFMLENIIRVKPLDHRTPPLIHASNT